MEWEALNHDSPLAWLEEQEPDEKDTRVWRSARPLPWMTVGRGRECVLGWWVAIVLDDHGDNDGDEGRGDGHAVGGGKSRGKDAGN